MKATSSCPLLSNFFYPTLNHRQRTLLTLILVNTDILDNDIIQLFKKQSDFDFYKTKQEVKRLRNKRFNVPSCHSLLRSGLCQFSCGKRFPDINDIYNEFNNLFPLFNGKLLDFHNEPNISLKQKKMLQEFYQNKFQLPSAINFKFRFLKIQIEANQWLTIGGGKKPVLLRKIREISRNHSIFGVYYSLSSFVSSKIAEKSRKYILFSYDPVLDFDFKPFNGLETSINEKIREIKAVLPENKKRFLFTGRGFHCYISLDRRAAKEWANKLGADPTIFDDKRVVRLEGSINPKYKDLRICKEIIGTFQLKDFHFSI